MSNAARLLFAARAALLAATVAIGGCASLPGDVARPVSTAASDVASTALARIAAASTPDAERDRSGFLLLPKGDDALQVRLELIQRAEKAIDVQYYLIASDRTGDEFRAALADAAARGVRVRVLVDDLYATGQDAVYARLAALPNIEVRLFNPLPARGASFAGRIARSLHELERINHRMHNKLLVADATFAVAGGRNIADEYFDRGAATNFIDMDVLASGTAVAALGEAFDRFWNSPHAYPVQSLAKGAAAGGDSRTVVRATDRRAAESRRAEARPVDGRESDDADAAEPAEGTIAAAFRAGRLSLTHADGTVLADRPEKVEGAADAAVVAAGHRALIEQARSTVAISSPYFVPGASALATLGRALARDVKVSVLTNSLATTDEPIVHIGYSRRRAALLAAGARLHELMPGAGDDDDDDDDELVAGSGAVATERPEQGAFGVSGSSGRLHSKLAVVDGEKVFVGSMNMDRRSETGNTEYGLIIASPKLAADVTARLARELDRRSYRVALDGRSGKLRWVSGQGTAEQSHAAEPKGAARAGIGLRLVVGVIGEEKL